MITTNVSKEDGIINGMLGILKKIHFKNSTPSILFMSFPDDKLVGRLRRKHYLATFPEEVQQGWVPIKRTVQTFCLPKSARSKTSIGVERCQFPIEFCAATTIFKYQGKSAKSLEINLSGYNFKGGAYTALTRCETRLGNSHFGPQAVSFSAFCRS